MEVPANRKGPQISTVPQIYKKIDLTRRARPTKFRTTVKGLVLTVISSHCCTVSSKVSSGSALKVTVLLKYDLVSRYYGDKLILLAFPSSRKHHLALNVNHQISHSQSPNRAQY